jgi:fructoselysine transporter
MADSAGANRSEPNAGAVRAGGHRFHRSIGLLSASLAALAGWLYVYATVTALVWSAVWLAAGAVAYLGWARYHRSWPFGTKEIHEEFLEAQRSHPDRAPSPGTGGARWA